MILRTTPEVLIWLALTTTGILVSLRTLQRLHALLDIQIGYPETVAEVVAMSRHNIFAERLRAVAHSGFWIAGWIVLFGLTSPPAQDRQLADLVVVWALVTAYAVLVANSANELWLAEKLWGRRLGHLARLARAGRISLSGHLAAEVAEHMARGKSQPPADRPNTPGSPVG